MFIAQGKYDEAYKYISEVVPISEKIEISIIHPMYILRLVTYN